MWLLITDLIVLVSTFNVVHRFRMGAWIGIESPTLYALVSIVIMTLYVFDAYRSEFPVTVSRLPLRAAVSVWMAGIVLSVFVYLVGPADFVSLFGRGVLPVVLILFSGWAAFSRYLASSQVEAWNKNVRWLCIGGKERILYFLDEFGSRAKIDVLLYPEERDMTASQTEIKSSLSNGSISSRFDHLDTSRLDAVILATSNALPDNLTSKLMELRLKGLKIYDLAEFYELFMSKVPVFHLKDGWFVYSQGFDLLHHSAQLRVKRMIDLVVSLTGIILFTPLVLLAALAIVIDTPGNPIFRQTRTGLNGVTFSLYKLRTMVRDAEKGGISWTQVRDTRVTRVGRFLRATRMDELPQLWNVFKGEMSFIGPRPERPEFNRTLENEIPYYDMRHLIKPGITGWAQVMYRYGASSEDAHRKLEYDLYYIKNYSLLLDFAILLKTLRVVLLGKGQ